MNINDVKNIRHFRFGISLSTYEIRTKSEVEGIGWEKINNSFVEEQPTIDELLTAIKQGRPYTAVLRQIPLLAHSGQRDISGRQSSKRARENFHYAQHIALDFDEAGDFARLENLMQDELIGRYAAIAHTTMSHTEEAPRARVVFVLEQPVGTAHEYEDLVSALLDFYPQADQNCSDAARMYFGAIDCDAWVQYRVLPNNEVAALLAHHYEKSYIDELHKVYCSLNSQDDSILLDALNHIQGDRIDYIDWLKIIVALDKHWGTERTIEFVESWSTCKPGEVATKIKSLTSHSCDIGTVFFMAQLNGWDMPSEQSSNSRSLEEIPILWNDSNRHSIRDAYNATEPLNYIVNGLIPKASLCVFYGAPGTKKSMILCDMCASVVTGGVWLPKEDSDPAELLSFETSQTCVLWIDCDNGRRRTNERIRAVGRARNIGEDACFHFRTGPSPDFSNTSHVESVVAEIQEFVSGLVVIDNLSAVIGATDENSPRMREIMANLRYIVEQTHTTIILIHHVRKGKSDGRRGESLRGHSSIEASLDLAILVESSSEQDEVILTATKVRDSLENTRIGARFLYKHKGDTRELELVWFLSADCKKARGEMKAAEERSVVLDAVKTLTEEMNTPPNQSDIVKKIQSSSVNMGRDKIRATLSRLETEEVLQTQKGDKGAVLYTLIS